MNLPNKLTLVRLAIIPIIVALYVFPFAALGINLPTFYIGYTALPLVNVIACALFCFASITDFLDGYLARKNNQVTSFGKFADPIADKALTTTMFVILACKNVIPFVPVVIMLWRDIIVDGVRMIAANNGVVMSAGMLGKVKTASQMICIIVCVLNNVPFELIHIPAADILLWFSTIVSVLGGIDYYNQASDMIWESK